MDLSALAGNDRLKELLSQREEGRGLSHAYIISGPVGSGRHTLARILAAAMMCTGKDRPCGQCAPCKKVFGNIHPDVNVVSGASENKPISVDQIRTLRADAHIRPNEGERKVYLLEGADQMNASAQNAMLKLLEEGPAYAAFFLLAENGGGLLQTVRSRCEELTMAPVPAQQCQQWLMEKFPEKKPEAVRTAAFNCQGILGRAVEELEGAGESTRVRQEIADKLAQVLETGSELELFESAMVLDKQSRDELPKLLDALESSLAARMVEGGDRRRLFHAVELVRQLRSAAKLNANPGQLAGLLCGSMFL